MICPSSHLQKDCGKETRELAEEAASELAEEATSELAEEATRELADEAASDLAEGSELAEDSVVPVTRTKTWPMRRRRQKLKNKTKAQTGDEFTGDSIAEEEASRAVFHHPTECSPLLVTKSPNLELLLDTRKEHHVSSMTLIAMTSKEHEEAQARAAREISVTSVVSENDHRLHHCIDSLHNSGGLDIEEEYYCDRRDGLVVVNADKNEEFSELFNMVNANELPTTSDSEPLKVMLIILELTHLKFKWMMSALEETSLPMERRMQRMWRRSVRGRTSTMKEIAVI